MTEPSQYFKGRTVQEQMNEVIGYVDVRSAEVAEAKADDVLQPAEDARDDAIAAQHAAEDARDVTLGALSTKVDKLTGAGTKAYTHVGSTQGDIEIANGTTAATIPVRDANGRMQAADPASGATDKTLVTANWVSQTGDNAPNNLSHRNGNETYAGIKTFYCSLAPWALVGSVSSRYKWYEIMTFVKGQTFQEVLLNIRSTNQTIIYECHVGIDTESITLDEVITTITTKLKVAYYDDGTNIHIYMYTPNYGYFVAEASYIIGYRSWQAPKFTMTEAAANPQDNLPNGAVEVTIA